LAAAHLRLVTVKRVQMIETMGSTDNFISYTID
jgi:hypothetical protein